MTKQKNNMTKKVFITDADPKSFERYCTVYRSSNQKQQSFRLTRAFLKNIYNQAKVINKVPRIILTIPANEKENFIVECTIRRERKV